MAKLRDAQIQALALTERGRSTVVINHKVPQLDQHMANMVAELPRLVEMGLRTREEISTGIYKYSLTANGRRLLKHYGKET